MGNTLWPHSGEYHFGEIGQTFYVGRTSASEINYGYGGYSEKDIGLPEWGAEHWTEPENDNIDWGAGYRQCCTATSWGGFLLASHIMGIKDIWKHNALFDYVDRFTSIQQVGDWKRFFDDFTEEMWDTYRKDYGCFWTRDNQADIYSNGHYDCAGELVKCDWQASTCSECNLVTSCAQYPNQRALDYDPCGLGCDETSGQCTLTSARWEV